jgi:hypothetical protein
MRSSRAWLAALLLLPLAGCTGGAESSEDAAPVTLSRRAAPPAGTDESLRGAALELVDEREQALREGDRASFLSTVDPDELGFSATQARWFDNLALLPVTDGSFALGDESVMEDVLGAGDLQLPVDFTMRLRGFDRRPVTQRMVWTFVRSEDGVLLADDRNARADERSGWMAAPWDTVHIEVRRSGGILGIFDEETADHADYVMSDLAEATEAVRGHLPWWRGKYVVYGTSDVSAMAAMSAMAVDDTAGVAFPVLSRPGGPVAAYRIIVNPSVVQDVLSRGLVFRHELVHVALATADDASPVWLAEGAAEYVARSTYPVAQRRLIAAQQLVGVRPHTLETGQLFYQRDPGRSYALAALVCDYLASTRGEDVLWDLMGAFDPGSTAGGAEGVVDRELGLSTRELSARALAWARAS